VTGAERVALKLVAELLKIESGAAGRGADVRHERMGKLAVGGDEYRHEAYEYAFARGYSTGLTAGQRRVEELLAGFEADAEEART
jgi:hypothetical protein